MTFNENAHPRASDGKFREKNGAAPELALASSRLNNQTNALAESLGIDSLDDEGVTLNDIWALRSAVNRAEYRLLEYEAEEFLEEHHPEVSGLLISFDSSSGEPYVAGVEISLADPEGGKNYGEVRSINDGYEDVAEWATSYGPCFQRFENESMFDEYGTVLIDADSEWGEFTDEEDRLGLPTSARVYRFAERIPQ